MLCYSHEINIYWKLVSFGHPNWFGNFFLLLHLLLLFYLYLHLYLHAYLHFYLVVVFLFCDFVFRCKRIFALLGDIDECFMNQIRSKLPKILNWRLQLRLRAQVFKLAEHIILSDSQLTLYIASECSPNLDGFCSCVRSCFLFVKNEFDIHRMCRMPRYLFSERSI